MVDKTVKGLEPLNQTFEGASNLRIGIVHARWNDSVIKALVDGTVDALKKQGVKKENIVIKTVPGSYELPFACQKLIAGGKAQAASSSEREFDAVIAIGVLIKGSTMHFEYICDAVSHGLMRVQLDSGTPVVFGVLTALTDDQALERAGIGRGDNKGHNHGEDWGNAAVELASNVAAWGKGDAI